MPSKGAVVAAKKNPWPFEERGQFAVLKKGGNVGWCSLLLGSFAKYRFFGLAGLSEASAAGQTKLSPGRKPLESTLSIFLSLSVLNVRQALLHAKKFHLRKGLCRRKGVVGA